VAVRSVMFLGGRPAEGSCHTTESASERWHRLCCSNDAVRVYWCLFGSMAVCHCCSPGLTRVPCRPVLCCVVLCCIAETGCRLCVGHLWWSVWLLL
jgi:hypothetical protein